MQIENALNKASAEVINTCYTKTPAILQNTTETLQELEGV